MSQAAAAYVREQAKHSPDSLLCLEAEKLAAGLTKTILQQSA